mgnify:CR=1 FL=1
MATFTITAATNIDSLTSKAGSDTYNINGGTLTIDQDSRFGQNATTSATLGPVTTSATLGGTFAVDARYVRLIPYDTGSGNVPAYNTTVSQGGASGLLIGVYSALNVAPTTPGSAMPASGYIKVKQWNSVAYAAGALTGIGANATAADVAGWIEVVGNEQSTTAGVFTFNGLGNPTTPQFQGEWYYIGTTPGTPARTDTYQIPSNGNNVYMPGVWVETAAGSGTYEFWATTSSNALLAEIATDTRRGKYCWVSTAGVLRFGHDGTNSTGGAIPAAGCKIRTGNIFLTMAPNATPTVNSFISTLANRYRIGGSSLPNLIATKITCNWYIATSTYNNVTFTDCSFMTPVSHTLTGGEIINTRCGFGSPIAITATSAVDFVQCAYGVTLTDCSFNYGVFGASTRNPVRLNVCRGVDFIRCTTNFTGGTRFSNTNYGMLFNQSSNITVKDCVISGHISHTTGSNVTFTGNNEFWFDHNSRVGTATNISYLFGWSGSQDTLVEDITFPIAGQVPRAGLFTNSNGIRNTHRNIGTYSNPIDFTIYEEENAAWTRVTTTATVTTASPHGMVTGDRAYVYRSSATGAITLAVKDITVTGANTFTFVCLNAGAASGTLSFYGSCQSGATMCDVSTNNVEDSKTYNVHFKGTNGAIFAVHATAINAEIKNASFDSNYLTHAAVAGSNTILRSIMVGSTPGISTAVLGTHFEDIFLYGEGVATSRTGVAWARAAGVITVTATDHKLRTNDFIQVWSSTNSAGARESFVTIVVLDKDTFTYTGAASGTTSGTLNYNTYEGVIHTFMNAPSSDTASQAQITSGVPAFTGQGTLAAFTAGDQIVFETPDFILGHDTFARTWPIFPSSGGSPFNNVDIEYQLDRGSGFSAWKNMNVKRTSAAGTSGANTITVNSTTGLAVGDYVWMFVGVAGVGVEAQIVSIDSATGLTLSQNNLATFSGQSIMFGGQHWDEAAFPATGIKLKTRVTVFTAFSNAASYLQVFTNTTTASRQRLYSQATIKPVTITVKDSETLDPIENARVYIKTLSGGPAAADTLVLTGLTDSNGEISIDYGYEGDQPISGWVRKATGTPIYKQSQIAGTIISSGFASTISLVSDE